MAPKKAEQKDEYTGEKRAKNNRIYQNRTETCMSLDEKRSEAAMLTAEQRRHKKAQKIIAFIITGRDLEDPDCLG